MVFPITMNVNNKRKTGRRTIEKVVYHSEKGKWAHFRSIRPELFCKKGALRNCSFIGK